MSFLSPSHRYYKWEVLALLWIAFFLNQADRQIFNVVLPLIRTDLHLSDAQLGLIASIFIFVLAVTVPFAGFIGDMFSRKWICTVTVIFWSGATCLTGLSASPLQLIAFRSVATAGGEAFYAPANYALISDYHKKTRSLAMSIHQTSVYTGVILSGFLAAYIGELWGWRSAFYVFGAAGILLGIVMAFRLKDATPVPREKSGQEKPLPFMALSRVIHTPTAIMLTLAFAGMIFVNVGYLTWMPTFLHEKFNLSLSSAGFFSMFYMNVFAFAGVIASGKLSDFMVPKRRTFRLEIQALGMLAGAPFLYLMGMGTSTLITYVGLAGFGLTRGLYDANIYASLYDVMEPRFRASASGIMIMFAFITGATSPFLLGYIKPTLGLSMGISSLSAVSLLSAAFIFIALKLFFNKDVIDE